MARIMYWNVEKFGSQRFFSQRNRSRTGKPVGQGGLSDIDAATDRKEYLLSTIVQNTPDILVIVEVNRGTTGLPEGEVIDERATYDLMHEIRLATGNANWYLVPPLVSGTNGKAEGIAVYYNGANLYFTGPWRWPGGDGPAASATALANTNMGFYPQPYSWLTKANQRPGPRNPPNPADPGNALPNRTIPSDSVINAGLPEYQLAGQWNYNVGGDATRAQLQFPAAGERRPFLVTFYDIAGAVAPATHRLIKLMAFHAPPLQLRKGTTTTFVAGPAATGTANIANIFEMNQAPAANEVDVIVGDFNVPLWPVRNVDLPTTAFGPIIALGYTQMLQTVPDQNPDRSYRITHLKRVQDADPFNTNGFTGFGYMTGPGDGQSSRYDAIDNIFVRYPQTATAGGPAANMTIVNRITGSPYVGQGLPALPEGVPAGTGGSLAYPQFLNNRNCMPVPAGLAPTATPFRAAFRGWQNFKRIRSTSDHMALIVDI